MTDSPIAEASMGRTVLILYGSETGNAHDLAEELGRLTQRLHFSTEVLPLDSVEPNVLNSHPIVLISISTTGQGDLPANSKLFWRKILRKKLPSTYLARANVGIFGVGDTSYPQYNWAALKLHKRLRQLGIQDLVPRGEGDEQHPEGIDAAFVPWMQALRTRLLDLFPLSNDKDPIPDDVLLQPAWLLESSSESDDISAVQISSHDSIGKGTGTAKAASADERLVVTLRQNTRLTPEDHFQDVRHLAFTTPHQVPYLPGDILTIYPTNMPEDVEQVLSVLHWDDTADQIIGITPNPSYLNTKRPRKPQIQYSGAIHRTSTLRNLLAFHLDFNAIPRRSFFALIAHFTDDETQKERLLEFANPDLVDELFDYTTRPRRSILEVLQEFDTLRVPWQWAMAILPPLRGRQFSIASGGLLQQAGHTSVSQVSTNQSGTKFELLVAIVKYRTVIRKIRRGVCTRYLECLLPGAELRVSIQRGALGITSAELERPVVMIGPGTGLAPIRALIWQRWLWAQSQDSPADSSDPTPVRTQMGSMALFFGCRNKDSDYFFRDEWTQLQAQGVPLTVFPAFSRDQAKKVYVQDLILKEHELLYDLLHNQQGIVFICGSSGKMPQAVRGALLDVFQKGAGIGPDAAEKELKSLEKAGRYKQETW